MRRDVDVLVLNAVNTCWKTPMTLEILLRLLKETEPPNRWNGHMRQLFSDVSVGAIKRFCDHHGISPDTIRRYYEAYIVPLGDRSPDVERWVNGNMGTPL